MGTGGHFFALTEGQLRRLLAGELPHSEFLASGGGEQPREIFSDAASVWYELSQVLQGEAACGAEQTDRIPEMAGYSFSAQVQFTAASLSRLADGELLARCENALMEATPDEVMQAVQDLKAFYQRAAANRDAVLFRVA